jgi:hypothetical protein
LVLQALTVCNMTDAMALAARIFTYQAPAATHLGAERRTAMAMVKATKDFLGFLRTNPVLRMQIAAPVDKTLIYAGSFFKPMWKELADLRLKLPNQDFELLPEVLNRLPPPPGVAGTLKSHVELLTHPSRMAWTDNGFIIWRALSGIYASNAKGKVWVYVGSAVNDQKVLAATELGVLSRNPAIDPVSREVILYLKDCLAKKSGDVDINFGHTPG